MYSECTLETQPFLPLVFKVKTQKAKMTQNVLIQLRMYVENTKGNQSNFLSRSITVTQTY